MHFISWNTEDQVIVLHGSCSGSSFLNLGKHINVWGQCRVMTIKCQTIVWSAVVLCKVLVTLLHSVCLYCKNSIAIIQFKANINHRKLFIHHHCDRFKASMKGSIDNRYPPSNRHAASFSTTPTWHPSWIESRALDANYVDTALVFRVQELVNSQPLLFVIE